MKKADGDLVVLAMDLVTQDFGLEKSANQTPSQSLLLAMLLKKIEEMLTSDFERLMQIFYRIDLDERKVNDAVFKAENPAIALAEMVVERETQKAKFRMEYSQKQ